MARLFQIRLAALLLPLCAVWAAPVAEVAIRMENGAFRVTGWQAASEPSTGWASIFGVYSGTGDVPPMLGAYSVENATLTFQPRWPLSPGAHLRAVFHAPDGASAEASFDLPALPVAAPTTRVAQVYPSTDSLPSNQLKFYVYFSAPMQRGGAWQHLRLVDDRGATVELPFLELDQELWDPNYLRLTILFDPGRIKRGLASLEEAGPNMVEGRSYTLIIDRDWLDARSTPLQSEFRKSFRVVAADRSPVDPRKWQVRPPEQGTTGPLVVVFPKPMDYALLQRMIEVHGEAGALSGRIAVSAEETEWRFTPEHAWKPGSYQLTVDTALEDLAGNQVGRAFDVDTFDRVSKQMRTDTVSLPFQVSPGRSAH